MGGILNYSGIVTKVRAMSGKLLSEQQYRQLAGSASVSAAVEYLHNNTVYQGVFDQISEINVHRGEIERILMRSMYDDFAKIHKFCNLQQRKLLELYFCKYEIQVLKRVLRRIFHPGNQAVHQIRDNEAFHSYSSLDLTKINEADTVEELLEALQHTPYYPVLASLETGEEKTLFDYEMVLDLFYFSNIWKRKDRLLKGQELQLFTQIYGNQIDMLNMMWICRARKYYQIPPAKIYALIIPITYKLRTEQIRQMVEAESRQETEEAAAKTYYGHHYRELGEADLELLYRNILRRIYRADKKKHPYSITVVTGYLYEKEEEIDRITTILECIRYGLSPEETFRYVAYE